MANSLLPLPSSRTLLLDSFASSGGRIRGGTGGAPGGTGGGTGTGQTKVRSKEGAELRTYKLKQANAEEIAAALTKVLFETSKAC